jgi:hypothetical protein
VSNASVDFFAMNGDVFRCVDADAYLELDPLFETTG